MVDDKFIDVYTGEVGVYSEPVILRAMAIGSCVAVVVYDRHKKIGGLAHVMLPGRSRGGSDEGRKKYAEDAIDILLDTAKKVGSMTEGLEVSLMGGANIIGEGSISEQVVSSVLDYLKKLGIEPGNKRLGGTQRRSVSLDIESGKVSYTEGDGKEKEL